MRYEDLLADAAARFADDTANHTMTVLHDDGLYRHLRFKAPDTGLYWFDLVTWPGRLAFVGDMQSHVFARIADMFEFFRAGSDINPTYWAEKLVTDRDSTKRYSEEKLRRYVADHVTSYGDDLPGLREAVEERLLGDNGDWDLSYEESAREALRDFEFRRSDDDRLPFQFADAWEWDLRDWDWSFLWCCHAIKWGIRQYDAARTPVPAAAA